MPDTCDKLLSDGNICGLPVRGDHTTYCKFHELSRPGKELSQGDLPTILHYIRSTDNRRIDFSDCIFNVITFDRAFDRELNRADKPLTFHSSTFNGCTFDRINFDSDVYFDSCQFDNTLFSLVRFSGELSSFVSSMFDGNRTSFDTCTLNNSKQVDFSNATFNSNENPLVTSFIDSPLVSFEDANILSERFFIKIAINDISLNDHKSVVIKALRIVFSGLKVAGHFELSRGPEAFHRRQSEHFRHLPIPELDFSLVNFSQMKTSTFIKINLSKAKFTYSVLGSTNFVDVNWARLGNWDVLYEELKPTDDLGTGELIRQYVQLKNNYESAGDHIGAGDWFYGEMRARERELQEKSKSISGRWNHFRLWFVRRLHWAYKAISSYGENDLKALVWVFGVLIVFAVPYFYNGFSLGDDKVEYNLSWGIDWQNCKDFGKALLYSVGVMSFQSGKSIAAGNTWTTILNIVQTILTVILVPMYLLALRRKFRR